MFFSQNQNRMRMLLPFFMAVAIFSPAAHAETGGEKLSKACGELIKIYDKKGEKSLFSNWTTSPAEAMKAGYCLGVIDEYRRDNYYCHNTGWRKQAKAIVDLASRTQMLQLSTADLLKMSCAN